MPLATILADFKVDVTQCDSLIANVHKTDASGISILPTIAEGRLLSQHFSIYILHGRHFLSLHLHLLW